jgi:hypothetical protein
MAAVISLEARRRRKVDEEHARGIILFECAATLARRKHPALLKLIEESFGTQWLEDRIQETLKPHPRTDAARLPRRKQKA